MDKKLSSLTKGWSPNTEKRLRYVYAPLPDSGFTFRPGGATAGFRYCAVETVGCGGYSTALTNVVNQIFIMPGVDGSDSLEFQVLGPNGVVDSVVRVTFYPGNPPSRGKNK